MDDIQRTLLESLDDLSSSRSSIARRSRALTSLDLVLATICVNPNSSGDMKLFLSLQNGFECNVASRLLFALSSWLPDLQSAISTAPTEDKPESEAIMTGLVYAITQALSVLQGVTLLHSASKAYLGRKWAVQVLLDLLLISRHVPHTSVRSPHSKSASAPSLAAAVLDTLLCVLVDAPVALRSFEEVNGVEAVVKTLKRSGIEKDVRIKCIEFLYFYLLPEDEALPDKTSWETLQSPNLPKEDAQDVEFSIPWSTSSSSDDQSFSLPNPAHSPKAAQQNHAFLRRELEFVPSTPRKKVAKLGVGSPRAPSLPKTPSRPSFGVRSPIRRTSNGVSTIRESLSTGGGGGSVPDSPTKPRSIASALSLPPPTQTPRRGKENGSPVKRRSAERASKQMSRQTSSASTLVSTSPTAARDFSWAENTTLGRPPRGVQWGADPFVDKVAKGPTATPRLKTTAEKKELLSTWLGNVDALVEGVQRAGAWGLG